MRDSLPFFDLDSSASCLLDLLRDADPPFQSVALTGDRSADLAAKLSDHIAVVPTDTARADVVISFDEIHLLPRHERRTFALSLAQRATRELIIACPLGTDLQLTIYRSLAKFEQELRLAPAQDLTSALQFGLPDPREAADWAHGFPDLDLFYAGDVSFFQDQATRWLRDSALSPVRKLLLQFAAARAPSVTEEPLPPETVPMRRHRRLFLVIRKR